VEARYSGATLVRVRLETGRRNQIRVHFAEAGHPVLGDPRYRPELAKHPQWSARRLALHAALLGFRHPISGKDMRFEPPLPQEFRSIRKLK
jgi:23S rRNA pseudouridine1911/1915/1917 synthase